MSEFGILFVHNNFPGQFRNLALALAAQEGVCVRAIGTRMAPGLPEVPMQRYSFKSVDSAVVHTFARRFDLESRRAEQVIYAVTQLKLEGFSPQLIYVHPGWGEALPLRALFPDAVICAYAEFYYWPKGVDIGFDPEAPRYGVDGETRISLRNAATLLALVDADVAISPTQWQRSVFPEAFREKIHVLHDGLDTGALLPQADAADVFIGNLRFRPSEEIVTFVSRNLEPYRGFHIFMRALPEILKARPQARICIMGGDEVSYGARPDEQASWRAVMLAELGDGIDLSRVHFLGKVAYEEYLALLRLSRAHVYLTYPFVLSWSLLEAMALERLVIASATAPVQEVIEDGVNGLLVPFFDAQALAARVAEALSEPQRFAALRREARSSVVSRFDFRERIWPGHLDLLEDQPGCAPLLRLLRR